jgi:ABC-type amino acid transport system permease subunit
MWHQLINNSISGANFNYLQTSMNAVVNYNTSYNFELPPMTRIHDLQRTQIGCTMMLNKGAYTIDSTRGSIASIRGLIIESYNVVLDVVIQL